MRTPFPGVYNRGPRCLMYENVIGSTLSAYNRNFEIWEYNLRNLCGISQILMYSLLPRNCHYKLHHVVLESFFWMWSPAAISEWHPFLKLTLFLYTKLKKLLRFRAVGTAGGDSRFFGLSRSRSSLTLEHAEFIW